MITDIANYIGIFYLWDEGFIGHMDKKITKVLVEVYFGGGLLSTLDLTLGSFLVSA